MPCTQWYRLVESYIDAVHSYSDAAKALSVLPGPEFNETWQRAEHARTESARDQCWALTATTDCTEAIMITSAATTAAAAAAQPRSPTGESPPSMVR